MTADPDQSVARQLECQSVSDWYQLVAGRVPLQAAHYMDQECRRTGKPFPEVLLDSFERGKLILVQEEDRADARVALLAAGRHIPQALID